jgi:hypothetical protein
MSEQSVLSAGFGRGERDHVSDAQPRESDPKSELLALNEVVAALQRLNDDAVRQRVMHAAAAFFGLSIAAVGANRVTGRNEPLAILGPSALGSFSEDRSISPKDFLLQKQPHTEVERVACLAYYLTHYRNIPHFKTIDISKLNSDAAQPKFGNAAQAVENATKMDYLVPASKGAKQLSAPGELFVQALPDREAARTAMSNARPRRRPSRLSNTSPTYEADGRNRRAPEQARRGSSQNRGGANC